MKHDQVEQIIAEDIQRLRNNATPGVLGWTEEGPPHSCSFSADLFMSLGDQPERRGANVLQLGGSRHHSRWRHACDYGQVASVQPACADCFAVMMICDSTTSRNDVNFDKRQWKTVDCNICTNWSKDLSSPLLEFERSASYPDTHILGGLEGPDLYLQ